MSQWGKQILMASLIKCGILYKSKKKYFQRLKVGNKFH